MNIFEKHEIFEIEVLELLKNNRFLLPLVFGGDTMLRLCHDLDRYSADLDFWIIKEISIEEYFNTLKSFLKQVYELTDVRIKHFSLLFELRNSKYPRRLKIEIRKESKKWETQEKIAFSTLSNIQVLLRTHSLRQTMINKVEALQSRNEIRDAYDIEFLLRKGINLPALNQEQKNNLIARIHGYTKNDFKVKLGSIVNAEKREYYIINGFAFLKEKLIEL